MNTITIEREKLEEIEVKGKRLGRHVNHDSRSKAFRVAEPAGVASQSWDRSTPILDQGNLGSCTGNASAGVLGTAPFSGTLPAGFRGDEKDAVAIYSLATTLDTYPGNYPPTDTGSDGLSAAKACKQKGYINGYTHALSLDDVVAGLQSGPGIMGASWYTGMDTPSKTGLVKPTGTVRGGHEFEIYAVDVDKELFSFWNSWGTSFGVNGGFNMSFDSLSKLLSDSGDVTFFTPLTSPPPTPQPTTDVTKIFSTEDAAVLDAWAKKPHIWSLSSKASKIWLAN